MQTEINGYRIEQIDENSSVAYKLHGKKGKIINLVRNENDKDLFFMINAKTWKEEFIDGYNLVRFDNNNLKLIKFL